MIENYNLFDISTPKQWKTISSKNLKEDGVYPVYGANGIIGYYDKYNHEQETVLITCRGATCGSVNLSKPFSYINGNAMAIDNVDNSKINTKYLFYFFKQYNFNNVITGTAQPQITRTSLKNVTVPIPDLPTQNKIVTLLDKASALVQKREESIALLDELLRAQFLEMFGEAPTNKKNWDSAELGTFLDFMTSGSRGWAKYYRETGDKFLRINNLGYNNLNLEELKFIETPNTAEAKRTKIQPKDVLLSITADLGRTAVVPDDIGDTFINQHIALLRFNDKLNPYFISAFISSLGGRHLLERYNKGAAKSGLNFNDIKSLNVHIPPIKLQNQFETIYHNIQSQKDTLSQYKTELENLYNSLLQRAFSGQLNFNVDIELDALLAAIDIEQDTEKDKHDIKEIATVYAGRLLERIEEQKFDNQTQYQQAKQVVFQMLEEGIVAQAYDEKAEAVKLTLV